MGNVLFSRILPGMFRLVLVCVLSSLLLLASAIPGLRHAIQWWLGRKSKKQLPHLTSGDQSGKRTVVVGFFHPYCNAGGGGERVLWVAIRAIQQRYDFVKCIVYTGDTDATPEEMLDRAKKRFNIVLKKPVQFVYLTRRPWVEDSKYPHFTLLGQSLGSVLLGWEALSLYVPDIFIDTMGFAFTLPLFKNFGGCRVGCYVHYPTISTDMLNRVSQRVDTYNNASFVSKSKTLSTFKLWYYKLFAALYGIMGRQSDVIMTNSSWTEGHILNIWKAPDKTHTVYPPCDTKEFLKLPLNSDPNQTSHSIVSVAQFRPEKDHRLQLLSFDKFLSTMTAKDRKRYKLVLIGGCRNGDDLKRVEELRDVCKDLDLLDFVSFKLTVPFDELKQSMADATIGFHTMWNEHFGIGVVELMAAGTVVLAHNSGGPKMDIVTKHNGRDTGFLAHDVDSYADAMETIFKMSLDERLDLINNARESVDRFSDEEFEDRFLGATESLFNHI